MTTEHRSDSAESGSRVRLSGRDVVRALVAGGLMGLANLVPGISGGTMLVAAGLYTRFIDAVSDVTRLRLRGEGPWILGLVLIGAFVAIGGFSGLIALALVEARWAMYSLFIGLTLGGAPLLVKMLRPMSAGPIVSCVVGIAAMLGVVLLQSGEASGGAAVSGPIGLGLAGILAASAMILPGISGAYLLLLLGAYETLIDAIKEFIKAGTALDIGGAVAQLPVLVPIGIGVVIGVVGVSNILKWVLHRWERPTIGFLLGLLLAAPAGLYPFARSVEPMVGDVIKGQVVTEESRAEIKPKDWKTERFVPSAGHVAGAVGLVGVGFAATLGVARLGREKEGTR